MTERKSPTAVLREGPRALSDEQVREIEDSALAGGAARRHRRRHRVRAQGPAVAAGLHHAVPQVPQAAVGRLRPRLQPGQDRLAGEDDRGGAAVVHRRRVRLPPRRAAGRDRAAGVHDRRQRGGEAPHRRADRGRGAAHGLLRPVLPGGRRAQGRRHHGHSRRVVPVGVRDVRRAVRPARVPGRRAAAASVRRAGPGALRHQLLPVDRGRAGAVGDEGDAVLRPLARVPARLLHRLHRDLPGRVAARAGRACATCRTRCARTPR